MIGKHCAACIILLFSVTCTSSALFGVSFTSQDLAGTWYGHQVVAGDAPADEPRWGYGTATIDSAGNFTVSWTDNGVSTEVSSGTIQITPTGVITINNQPLTHGVINDGKDLIVFTDGTADTDGKAMTILIKRSAGESFAASDLAGTWYGFQVVSGDAPADEPRWGYGTATITGSGNYTVSWTSPGQANEQSAGTMQINGDGIITINNQPLMHGAMNDAKDLIVFTDGTVESEGNSLTVMIRRSPSAAFATADLAGDWYGHQVVSGDAPADDPRWGYGTVSMSGFGNYTASWNSPTQSDEISSGTIQITADGIITVNGEPLTHGAMNDGKDLFVFIDGSSESSGNALVVLIKRAKPPLSGPNMLLLKLTD